MDLLVVFLLLTSSLHPPLSLLFKQVSRAALNAFDLGGQSFVLLLMRVGTLREVLSALVHRVELRLRVGGPVFGVGVGFSFYFNGLLAALTGMVLLRIWT